MIRLDKRFFILSFLLAGFLMLSIVWFFSSIRIKKNIVLLDTLSFYDKEIKIKNQQLLLDSLQKTGLITDNEKQNFRIEIVERIQNPILVRSDSSYRKIISASYEKQGDDYIFYLSPSRVLLEGEEDKLLGILEYFFIELVKIAMKKELLVKEPEFSVDYPIFEIGQ